MPKELNSTFQTKSLPQRDVLHIFFDGYLCGCVITANILFRYLLGVSSCSCRGKLSVVLLSSKSLVVVECITVGLLNMTLNLKVMVFSIAYYQTKIVSYHSFLHVFSN